MNGDIYDWMTKVYFHYLTDRYDEIWQNLRFRSEGYWATGGGGGYWATASQSLGELNLQYLGPQVVTYGTVEPDLIATQMLAFSW